MRRAIVHIGTPRTGTTSFQAVLSSRRDELHRAGLLYPDLTPRAAPGPHLSHQYVGEAFDGRRPRHERTELLTMLDAQLAATTADVAILSYEGLCLLRRGHALPSLLAEIFARHDFRMEIMLTVKAQALYAQSQYTWRCQFLREKHFFAETISRDLRHRRYDYAAMIRNWEHPPDRPIHVIPVHDSGSNAPLIDRIFQQLGLKDRVDAVVTSSDSSRRENLSLGPVAIEAARRLCRNGAVPRDRTSARAITDFLAEQARARGFDATPFRGLDSEMAARAEETFALTNERFAQHVWGESWSRRIPKITPGAVNELRPGAIDPDTAILLDRIIALARKRFAIGVYPSLWSVWQDIASSSPLRAFRHF